MAKTELYFFSSSTVFGLRDPFPRWIFTPAFDNAGNTSLNLNLVARRGSNSSRADRRVKDDGSFQVHFDSIQVIASRSIPRVSVKPHPFHNRFFPSISIWSPTLNFLISRSSMGVFTLITLFAPFSLFHTDAPFVACSSLNTSLEVRSRSDFFNRFNSSSNFPSLNLLQSLVQLRRGWNDMLSIHSSNQQSNVEGSQFRRTSRRTHPTHHTFHGKLDHFLQISTHRSSDIIHHVQFHRTGLCAGVTLQASHQLWIELDNIGIVG